jgi:hypothetical protein
MKEPYRSYRAVNKLGLGYKKTKILLKEPRNRPDVAQRVPGDLGSQIFMTFDT